jgi:hypothetical protein
MFTVLISIPKVRPVATAGFVVRGSRPNEAKLNARASAARTTGICLPPDGDLNLVVL